MWIRFTGVEEHFARFLKTEKTQSSTSSSTPQPTQQQTIPDPDDTLLTKLDSYMKDLYHALPSNGIMIITTGSEPLHPLHSYNDRTNRENLIERLRASMVYLCVK
jgi:hypothetical protein